MSDDVKEIRLDIAEHKELVKILEENALLDQLRSELYLRDIENAIQGRKDQIKHNEAIHKLFEYEVAIQAMQMLAVVSIALSLFLN